MRPTRIMPRAGQESVWDYPRPPRVEPSPKPVRVVFGRRDVASSSTAWRVLETSHPPVFYLPEADIDWNCLVKSTGVTHCEWKGVAHYFDVVVENRRAVRAAWCFPEPKPGFESIRDCVAFYPQLMDACFVGDEEVLPQAGDFYGGWITSDVVGPFKGEPGTWGW